MSTAGHAASKGERREETILEITQSALYVPPIFISPYFI